MCRNSNYFKNYFANFQAQYDEQSYRTHRELKSKLFSNVSGRVLELGPGTGVNFKFLSGKKIEWTGLEPNLAMHSFLKNAAIESGIRPNIVTTMAEEIDNNDDTFDFVISTEVLCSVEDVDVVLNQVKRVLKPGGKFIFLEHEVDRDNTLRRCVQKLVPYTPWRYYSDGCRPGRDLTGAIGSAGFSHVSLEAYMQEGSGIIQMVNRPHIVGAATK